MTFEKTADQAETSVPRVAPNLLPTTLTDIQQFLARPIQLASFTGNVYTYDCNVLLQHPEWKKKLSLFDFVKCDFCFEFKPVQSPFIYGLVGYTYGYQFETYPMDPETVSTRNVVYQDLGNNQVVKVRIPYCSPFQAYDAKTQGTSALTARRSIPILFATDSQQL